MQSSHIADGCMAPRPEAYNANLYKIFTAYWQHCKSDLISDWRILLVFEYISLGRGGKVGKLPNILLQSWEKTWRNVEVKVCLIIASEIYKLNPYNVFLPDKVMSPMGLFMFYKINLNLFSSIDQIILSNNFYCFPLWFRNVMLFNYQKQFLRNTSTEVIIVTHIYKHTLRAHTHILLLCSFEVNESSGNACTRLPPPASKRWTRPSLTL